MSRTTGPKIVLGDFNEWMRGLTTSPFSSKLRAMTRLALGLTCGAVLGLALAVTTLVGAAGTQRLVAAGGYHVMGVGGSTTCADMTRNLSKDRESWRAVYANYAYGFVTGANFAGYVAKQPNTNVGLFDITPDALMAAVHRYCQTYPAKGMHEAVARVYSELASQQSR